MVTFWNSYVTAKSNWTTATCDIMDQFGNKTLRGKNQIEDCMWNDTIFTKLKDKTKNGLI